MQGSGSQASSWHQRLFLLTVSKQHSWDFKLNKHRLSEVKKI